MTSPVESVRRRFGGAVFARIAGDEGAGRRERIFGGEGHRRFGPDDPIQRVHGDAAMFVGGLRALLLQSLHPLAMAAVDQHSGYRGDPWGRLQRTSTYIAETTFGTDEVAARAVETVRRVHEHITGTAPDGRPYAASDPHLLAWVHLAEVDSFLAAYDAYGGGRLAATERDTYVEQSGQIARLLGVLDPPGSVAQLRTALEDFRPELHGTSAARRTARFIIASPPLPLALRPGYAALVAAAIASLPRWTRIPLRVPYLPVTEATVVRASGLAATSAIRWALR